MLPHEMLSRLKPGLMARPDPSEDRWTLYDPVTDADCRFALVAPAPGELAASDLDLDDRIWQGGSLDVDLYHLAKSVRAHRDLHEANLEVNYACGYSCRHCFQSLVPAGDPGGTRSRADVLDAAARLIASGCREVSVTGGDVFLSPYIWDLLDFIDERAPKTTARLLASGGGLVIHDPSVRQKLQRLGGRRLIVKADFYGHTPELHDDFTRAPGSFTRLVEMIAFLRASGIACMPAAVLTHFNFEYRFELVNFVDLLSGNAFTVSSAVYPSAFRSEAELARLRVTPDQHWELMEERFFAPLAAEYHTSELQCGGDCQYAVVSASGRTWGCTFLKIPPSAETIREPLDVTLRSWRRHAAAIAPSIACVQCPAAATCRKCPAFLASAHAPASYCAYSRQARQHVTARARAAVARGFSFLDESARSRYLEAAA